MHLHRGQFRRHQCPIRTSNTVYFCGHSLRARITRSVVCQADQCVTLIRKFVLGTRHIRDLTLAALLPVAVMLDADRPGVVALAASELSGNSARAATIACLTVVHWPVAFAAFHQIIPSRDGFVVGEPILTSTR